MSPGNGSLALVRRIARHRCAPDPMDAGRIGLGGRGSAAPGLRAFVLIAAAAALTGCRGLSREFNQSLPEFLRADPGKEELEIFAKVQHTREWSAEDLARQSELVAEARAAYDAGDFSGAADQLEDFLEQYPGSAHDEQARYLWGDAYYRDDSWEKAFRVFKDFAALYPVSDLGPQVMELEYLMGKEFIEGRRATFFGIFTQRGTGERIMTHIVEAFPGGARAADAQWALARYHMEDEDWVKASADFRYLAESYRTSEWYGPSLYYAAYCKYRQMKGSVYDPVTMTEAREGFEAYLRNVPEGAWRQDAAELAAEIENEEAEHVLGVGEWYIGQGKEYSARYYLFNVMTRFPRTPAAERARDVLAGITPAEPPPPESAPAPAPADPAPGTPPADPAPEGSRPAGSGR